MGACTITEQPRALSYQTTTTMKILEKNTTEQFGFITHEYIVEYFSDKYRVFHDVDGEKESFDMYSVDGRGEIQTTLGTIQGRSNVWHFSIKKKIINHIKNVCQEAQ